MTAPLPAPLLEECAKRAHADYRARGPRPLFHAPGDCHHAAAAMRAGLAPAFCAYCDQLLRPWPDLTEAQRETFRAQVRPAVEVVAPVLDDASAVVSCAEVEKDVGRGVAAECIGCGRGLLVLDVRAHVKDGFEPTSKASIEHGPGCRVVSLRARLKALGVGEGE